MAEFKTTAQSNLAWGETFKMAKKAPAIANRIFETYADALEFANDVSANGTAINGLILSVFNDTDNGKNGAYRIASVATEEGANDAVLEKVGSGLGTSTARTYEDAITMATSGNVGQIIYVTTTTYGIEDSTGGTHYSEEKPEGEEGKDYFTYSEGAYIVSGAGTLMKLAETSSTGDYGRDIAVLQLEVKTLQEEVETLQDEIDETHTIKGDDFDE